MSRKIARARDLRRDSSLPERICWELLRAHRMDGIKFRRQHPIGPYFADFACVSRKIAIEIDGEHHAYQLDADARRTKVMESEGWRVVRFTAREVLENREGIWVAIKELIANDPSPSLPASPPLPTSPPLGGEEEETHIPLPR